MKKFILFATFIAGAFASNAQIKVGNNPQTLAPNTLLQVEPSDPAKTFTVDDAGNVGVGTATPNSPLHVEGNTYINGTLEVTDAPRVELNTSLSTPLLYDNIVIGSDNVIRKQNTFGSMLFDEFELGPLGYKDFIQIDSVGYYEIEIISTVPCLYMGYANFSLIRTPNLQYGQINLKHAYANNFQATALVPVEEDKINWRHVGFLPRALDIECTTTNDKPLDYVLQLTASGTLRIFRESDQRTGNVKYKVIVKRIG